MASPTERRTVECPPLCTRAAFVPNTINIEQRTVGLIFTTGAAVLRQNFFGERWWEELSLKPEHIRLGRLNSGAPLLDTHSGYSLAHQIGVVQDGSARVAGGQGLATVRFSKRAQVQPFFDDVVDGVYRNASMGYLTYKWFEKPEKHDGLPVRVAVDWEPHEISMVPIPADAGAQVRSKTVETHLVEIVTNTVRSSTDEDRLRRIRVALASLRVA